MIMTFSSLLYLILREKSIREETFKTPLQVWYALIFEWGLNYGATLIRLNCLRSVVLSFWTNLTIKYKVRKCNYENKTSFKYISR